MKTESSSLDQNKMSSQVAPEDSNAGNKGRSAVLIHVMALLIMILVLAFGFLGGFLTPDGLTLVAVMGSAGGIGWLWSLVLSVQAVRKKAWRVMGFWVLYAALVDVSVLLLVMWFLEYGGRGHYGKGWELWRVFTTTKMIFDAAFYVALPVLLPTLSLTLGLYAILKRRAQKVEGRRASDSEDKSHVKTPIQKKKTILFVGLFFVLVFPFSLFFFSLSNHGSHRRPDWRIEVVRVAPQWLGTSLDWAMPSGVSVFVVSRNTLLREGIMTRATLLNYLNAADQGRAILAFGSLLRRSDDAALPWLKNVVNGKAPGNIRSAYHSLAKNGSVEDISEILSFAGSNPGNLLVELLNALYSKCRSDVREQIVETIRGNRSNERIMALLHGKHYGPFFTEPQLETIWKNYFKYVSPDSPFTYLYSHLLYAPPKAFNRILQGQLLKVDPFMRKYCLYNLKHSVEYFPNNGMKMNLRNLEICRTFLVSKDNIERRLAAYCWMTLLNKSFKGIQKLVINPNGTYFALPINEKEQKVFKRLPELAGQYIEQRKKEASSEGNARKNNH